MAVELGPDAGAAKRPPPSEHSGGSLGHEFLRGCYPQLCEIARRHLRHERRRDALEPAALVNEAMLRLLAGRRCFEGAPHFLRTASRAMRLVLVDEARARNARKRTGGPMFALDDIADPRVESDREARVIEHVLARLAEIEPRPARVVRMRFLQDLEVHEVAAALGVSSATVKRDWRLARAWLARTLRERVPAFPDRT